MTRTNTCKSSGPGCATRRSERKSTRSSSDYKRPELKTEDRGIEFKASHHCTTAASTESSHLSKSTKNSTFSPSQDMTSSRRASVRSIHEPVSSKDEPRDDHDLGETEEKSIGHSEELSPFVQEMNEKNTRISQISNNESSNSNSSEIFVGPPKRPQYRSVDTRLRTFENWDANNPMKPEDLARAGWYYEGNEDKVRCYQCGGGLFSWQSNDNPLEEHKKWFPLCGFLHQLNGETILTPTTN